MFIMLNTVGSFGVIIAMVWLMIATIRLLIPPGDRPPAGMPDGRRSHSSLPLQPSASAARRSIGISAFQLA